MSRVSPAELLRRQAHEAEQLGTASATPVRVPAEQLRDQFHVALDRPVGKQPSLLLHVAGVTAQHGWSMVGCRASGDKNLALGGFLQPIEHAQQCGLAAAALTDEHNCFALSYLEVDAAQGMNPAGKTFADAPGLHGHSPGFAGQRCRDLHGPVQGPSWGGLRPVSDFPPCPPAAWGRCRHRNGWSSRPPGERCAVLMPRPLPVPSGVPRGPAIASERPCR